MVNLFFILSALVLYLPYATEERKFIDWDALFKALGFTKAEEPAAEQTQFQYQNQVDEDGSSVISPISTSESTTVELDGEEAAKRPKKAPSKPMVKETAKTVLKIFKDFISAVWTFYHRRMQRLFPLYYFTLIVYTCYVQKLDLSIPENRTIMLRMLTFTYMFTEDYFYAAPFQASYWSIAIEIWFSVAFPFLAALMQLLQYIATGVTNKIIQVIPRRSRNEEDDDEGKAEESRTVRAKVIGKLATSFSLMVLSFIVGIVLRGNYIIQRKAAGLSGAAEPIVIPFLEEWFVGMFAADLYVWVIVPIYAKLEKRKSDAARSLLYLLGFGLVFLGAVITLTGYTMGSYVWQLWFYEQGLKKEGFEPRPESYTYNKPYMRGFLTVIVDFGMMVLLLGSMTLERSTFSIIATIQSIPKIPKNLKSLKETIEQEGLPQYIKRTLFGEQVPASAKDWLLRVVRLALMIPNRILYFALSNCVLQLMGVLCYSIYLWHFSINFLDMAQFETIEGAFWMAVKVIAISVMSYRYIEFPNLTWKQLFFTYPM